MAFNDNNNGIITAPVSIRDVEQALAHTEGDLARLCRYSGVNKWAKYKPVRFNAIDTSNQLNNIVSDKTWGASSTWWKANDGNCGITYVTFSSILGNSGVKAAIDNQTPVWGREAPNQYYRLLDFLQYNPSALPPVAAISAEDAIIKAGATLRVMAAKSPAAGDNITLADVGDFSNFRFTAAFINTDETIAVVHSDTRTLGQRGDSGDLEVVLEYQDGNNGYQGKLVEGSTYKVYCFLSNYQYEYAISDLNINNLKLIPIPLGTKDYGVAPTEIEGAASSQWLVCEPFIYGAGNTIVSWKAYMYGTTSGQQATISLIDRFGNVVSNQSHTIDFANGSDTQSPLPTGKMLTSNARNSFQLPTAEPENYRVKLDSVGYKTVISPIGYEINIENNS